MNEIEEILDEFAKCFCHTLSDYGNYFTERTRAAQQIRDTLVPQGDDEGLIKSEVILDILRRAYRGVPVMISQWHFEIAKAQQALTRQEIPEAVKLERERMKLCILQAIADEPEFPDSMPDKLWKELDANRNNIEKAMQGTVRLTKNGITERFLKSLKGE